MAYVRSLKSALNAQKESWDSLVILHCSDLMT